MKKILIIYGSVGLGHKVVAENIAEVLRSHKELQVAMLDVLELYRGPFTNISSKIYQFIIKYLPSLWVFFYTNRIFQKLTLPLRVPLASLKSKKFNRYVATVKPDLILTTHPTATALSINLKKQGQFAGPIVTTFSDFHFQPYWVYKGVDKYLVMTGEQQQEVVRLGFQIQDVIVTGLPVDSVFFQEFNKDEVFKELGLISSKPTILLMGGSRGWGVKFSDVKALLAANLDAQIVVVTGINPELQEKLEALSKSTKSTLKIFGSWSNEKVAKLFSVASILITKPGGLTIGQALLKNLPMILINPLPTMEELNEDYIISHKAGLSAKNSEQLVKAVKKLLLNQELYRALKINMQKIAIPKASQKAADTIIDMLNKEY